MWDWDPNPETAVMVDLETQSAASLPKVGAPAYLRDPSTRLLSLVAARGREVVVWAPRGRYPGASLGLSPSDCWPPGWPRDDRYVALSDDPGPPRRVLEWLAEGATFVAHNAQSFDAEAWARLVPAPCPRAWCDTVPMCRAAGLPGGLDAVGLELCGVGKDKASARAMKLLCAARATPRGVVYPVGTQELWRTLLRYNVQDVLLLREVFRATLPFGEADVLAVDTEVNGRGVRFDRPYLLSLLVVLAESEADAAARVEAATGGLVPACAVRSAPAVKGWLRSLGLRVDSLERKELDRLYEDPEAFFGEVPDGVDLARVVEVLRFRQAATRATRGKLARVLESAGDDDRVRGAHVYHKAHTGRWSGRGFQPHNLPRGVPDLDVASLARVGLTLAEVRAAAAACRPDPFQPTEDDALSTLVRGVFVPSPGGRMLVADYASVEARCVAWLAGESWMLAAFADPARDLYLDCASRIFGHPCSKADVRERFIGKETVLGCGYGMSEHKFKARCDLKRVSLEAAGTTALACVESYRDSCPHVAGVKVGGWRRGGLWRDYEKAAKEALARPGFACYVGRCAFCMEGAALHIRLPSGREMVYRRARVEMRVPGYCALLGLPPVEKPTIVYQSPHGYESSLYGGLITENVSQAVCRDLLATSLVLLSRAGFSPVLHVHDEVVCDEPDGSRLREMLGVMSTPPPWARGFPLGVEGFGCERYVKGAKGLKALNGRVL